MYGNGGNVGLRAPIDVGPPSWLPFSVLSLVLHCGDEKFKSGTAPTGPHRAAFSCAGLRAPCAGEEVLRGAVV